MVDQFDDMFIQILLSLACVSLFFSFFSEEDYKWLESVSVFVAVGLATLIASLCDYGKEQQFLNLQREILSEECTVLRGQYGTSSSVLVNDLVVGDVVLLEQGDRVPADCLLLDEMNLKVDERSYFPDASGPA